MEIDIPISSSENLHGDLHIPQGAKGIVLFAHGSGSSRHSPRNRFVAGVLNTGGLATLLIDLLTAEEEQNLADNVRAILDGETMGFVKIHLKQGTDQILGATIMARHAGEMISEISVAMTAQKGLAAIAEAIHPFPAQAEILRSAAEAGLKAITKTVKPSKKSAA